jgi:hypothetical protein
MSASTHKALAFKQNRFPRRATRSPSNPHLSTSELGTSALLIETPTFNPGTPTFELGISTFNPGTPTFELGILTFELGTPTFELGTSAFMLQHPSSEPETSSNLLQYPSSELQPSASEVKWLGFLLHRCPFTLHRSLLSLRLPGFPGKSLPHLTHHRI